MSGKTHIIVPDSHAHPDFNNNRYTWLGKLIADVQPDVVVDIGDFFDMASLCSYDKGKKSFEGRRYHRDIAAGVEAQDRMFKPIKARKRKLPRFVRCLGNHEDRINRAISLDPILDGTIGLNDLQSAEYGFEQYDYKTLVNVDGVNYSHVLTSGVKGLPVTSANLMLAKQHESCTMGHAHTFDYSIQAKASGGHLHGLICGVFQDYHADFAGPANEMWRPGVVVKRNVEAGNYDLEWISLKRLMEAYGDK